jgi:hypothetical protein
MPQLEEIFQRYTDALSKIILHKWAEDTERDEHGHWVGGGGGKPGGSGGTGGATTGGDRAARAKATHQVCDKAKRGIASASEVEVSKALGLARTEDNKPFDAKGNGVAVELKTIVSAKNDKITMHPESRKRKLAEAKKEKLRVYTVVVDKRGSTPAYYWAKGVGSFRLGGMNQAASLAALKKVVK